VALVSDAGGTHRGVVYDDNNKNFYEDFVVANARLI
jgi:hypothetical protein